MGGLRIRNILHPSDLTEESSRALAHACYLAKRFGARVTLYHAAETPDHAQPHWAFAHGHEVWCRAEREARHALEQEATTLGIPCDVIVERVASPPRALLALIRERQPDLTVMATHSRRGVRHMVLGSVTEQIFRHAFQPVLCVREPEHRAPLPYSRILVPTDMSLASRLSFPFAALLARSFGARVIALHALGAGSAAASIPSEAALRRFVAPDFEDVELEARVGEGPPWERIVQAARDEQVDLIVMSTRGHDSLSDVILGSNTDRVVRQAPCPVLVA